MLTALNLATSIAPWIIFLAFPLAILVGGILSFLVKVNKVLIGDLLLLFGIVETLFFSLLIEADFQMSHYIPIGIVSVTSIGITTVIVGIIRLYKSK